MQLQELYRYLDAHNIQLECYPLSQLTAMSMKWGGRCYIALDSSKHLSQTEERVILAHEIGHCMTDSFYQVESSMMVGKAEHHADRFAVQLLMPWQQVQQAFESGVTELWQLADAFSVPQWFAQKALSLYEQEGRYARPVAPLC